MTNTKDIERFIRALESMGGTASNQRLRNALGWQEAAYERIKRQLLDDRRIATLLSALGDLLREKETVSDEMIVHEMLNNWHESKKRIPEDRWLKALGWMRDKGFVPKGAGQP